MAPVFSKLTQRHAAMAGTSVAVLAYLYYKRNTRTSKLKAAPSAAFIREQEKAKKSGKAKEKAHVDAAFFRKLWKILKILVPGFFTQEVLYLFIVAASLLGRTYFDIWMIRNSTQIETGIIRRDMSLFLKYLTQYAFAMPGISIVNNSLKYGLNELKLRFRTRLSRHFYDKYLDGFTFYKMSNLDNRIANADQILTQDVDRFCGGIVDLYSNLSKPLLDVALYVYRLGTELGFQAPLKLLLYLLVSGIFLTWLRRPIGRMTVIEQQLEGEFRFVNSRLIVNSEEIAFYKGNLRERQTIQHSFEKLVNHLRNLILFRFSIGFVDNIVAKYTATVVGWYVVSRPFLDRNNSDFNKYSKNELIEVYYTNGRMMFQMASALGRLALAGREMTRLAGFTARMTELMRVLKDLNEGKYERTMVSDTGAKRDVMSVVDSTDNFEDDAGLSMSLAAPLVAGSGKIISQDNLIRFEHVPLVTPNGDVLIPDMNFEVRSGVNVLVCGPNGCGKSSLFRILGELWPLFGGKLTKPDKKNLFYIPQRPYMTLGSLRDQVIYPDTKAEMENKGIFDGDLERFLELVQLRYILAREGGWDVVQDWMDVLSGGEKQRIAMARLFYHAPQFAILDECTSAVSVDVEGQMYQFCRQSHITLFTVSHRKSLWKHHEYYLHMDGRGRYEFKPIDESTTEFGS